MSKTPPTNAFNEYSYDFINYEDNLESQSVKTLMPKIKENFIETILDSLNPSEKITLTPEEIADIYNEIEGFESRDGTVYEKKFIEGIFKEKEIEYLKYQKKEKDKYISDHIFYKRKELREAIKNIKAADKYLYEFYVVRDTALARYMELSRNFMLKPMYQKDMATILDLTELKKKLIAEGRAQEPLGKNRQPEDTRGARKYQRGNPRRSRLPDKDVVPKTDEQIVKGYKLRMKKGGLI